MIILVVSYRNSTSNHNVAPTLSAGEWLYLIEILHQTTTLRSSFPWAGRLYLIEILHQTTTAMAVAGTAATLYLIEILHQTTTIDFINARDRGCILSKFYIKPQPLARVREL